MDSQQRQAEALPEEGLFVEPPADAPPNSPQVLLCTKDAAVALAKLKDVHSEDEDPDAQSTDEVTKVSLRTKTADWRSRLATQILRALADKPQPRSSHPRSMRKYGTGVQGVLTPTQITNFLANVKMHWALNLDYLNRARDEQQSLAAPPAAPKVNKSRQVSSSTSVPVAATAAASVSQSVARSSVIILTAPEVSAQSIAPAAAAAVAAAG